MCALFLSSTSYRSACGSTLVEFSERNLESTHPKTHHPRVEIPPESIGLPEVNKKREVNQRHSFKSHEYFWSDYTQSPNLADIPRPMMLSGHVHDGPPKSHNGELTPTLKQWRHYRNRSSLGPTVMPSDREFEQVERDCYEVNLGDSPWETGDIDRGRWNTLTTDVTALWNAICHDPSSPAGQ